MFWSRMNGYCMFLSQHVGAEAEAWGSGSESRSPSAETEAEAESEAKAEAEGTGMGAVGCVLGSQLAALVRRGIPGIAYKGCVGVDHSSSSHSKQASSAIDSRLIDRKLQSQEQNGAYSDFSFFFALQVARRSPALANSWLCELQK